MSQNWLKPDWEPGLSIPNLPIKHLLDMGIKALVLDVDETLIPRREILLHSSVMVWIKNAKQHFTLHLVSNNPSKQRIQNISQQLNINFTYKAAKPTRSALRKVLGKIHLEHKKIAIVRDRIFTDVLSILKLL